MPIHSLLRSESPPFKPRTRMLVLLGDQLIRDAGFAIFELVKNTYDAEATRADVTLMHVADRARGRVIIGDDGCGTGWNGGVNVWLELGSDYRQQNKSVGLRTLRFNRLTLDEKDVGRFAVPKLASRICLVTQKVNCLEGLLQTDWHIFTTERYLSDAGVFKAGNHG